MTIYIDDEFRVFAEPAEGLTEVETGYFDGKCVEYIEGFRFVPEGSQWVREDGAVFTGEMASPWKPLPELEEAQMRYDRERLAEYAEALKIVGVSL